MTTAPRPYGCATYVGAEAARAYALAPDREQKADLLMLATPDGERRTCASRAAVVRRR